MLVLKRKIGQQIVLPGYGVTIDVVGVGRKQVSLAIAAPPEIPIHRGEVWDRIHRHCEDQPGGKAAPTNEAASTEDPESSSNWGTSPPDLNLCLAKWITWRTSGRIHQLTVKTVGDQTVVSGSVTSYYVRQLAQSAVNEVLAKRRLRPIPNVEYRFDVVDGTCQMAVDSSRLAGSRE